MALRYPVRYAQYRGHNRTSGPASEPITKADVKAQLRLDAADTSEDDLLDLYIQSAREQVEEYTGLALIDQSWELQLDHWPNDFEEWWDGVRDGALNELRMNGRPSNIILPRYPLQSVDSITADGDSVTISDVFITDTAQKPGRLVIKRGETWPTVLDNAAGIVIDYTAGYGSSATDVPAAIRLALIQMVVTMYEHRGDGCSTEDAFKMSGAKTAVEKFKAAQL